jgi:hypothetical protein
LETRRLIDDIKPMTPTENATGLMTPVEEMQKAWPELSIRIGQLESDRNLLEQENKSLRSLLERVIEHRQKSHGELVLLLTNLVSKLPIGDVGFMVSKLVEHNNQVSEICATLSNSKAGAELPKPAVMKAYEQTKRDLASALSPAVEELVKSDAPLPEDMLRSLVTQPKLFFSPAVVRATRCFLKKQLPRSRVIREFGEEALVYFNDLTTDAKLNPRPKPEEIVLSFKPDAESLIKQNSVLTQEKQQGLLALFEKLQKSKMDGTGIAQKNAFLKLSFLIELLNYYENQGSESPDVLFAQRMPSLIEQFVITNERDQLDEKTIQSAESLLAYIINNDHRLMVVNNIGKAGGVWRTLKYVLLFRMEKIPELGRSSTDFIKHLIPTAEAPRPEVLAAIIRFALPDMQSVIVRAIIASDRLKRTEAENLSRAVAKELGLKGLEEAIKPHAAISAESENQDWAKIQELIANRADPAIVTTAVRSRLHAKYDVDEVKQSWITLTATDPMSLVRTFCQLPYLADGTTDPIARAVMESYASRLMHEKYADVYGKIVKNLMNLFRVKPDSPTLVNFLNLLKWVDAEAEKKMSADIGIHAAA